MAHTTQQDQLFDADSVAPDDALVLFVAVPTDFPNREVLLDVLRHACRCVEWRHGGEVRVLTGDNAGSSDPRIVPQWLRRILAEKVDGLLVVHGPSWGCSREDTLAGELLIPRLLAVLESAPRSAMAGPDGYGLCAEGRFCSADELGQVASDWLNAYGDDLLARHVRRLASPELSDAFRKPTLRAWNMCDDHEQRRVAQKFGMVHQKVSRLLMSHSSYAEGHMQTLLALACELGVWSGEAKAILKPAVTTEPLAGREFAAFEQARMLLRLDDAAAAELLARGMTLKRRQNELQAAGVDTRFSLRGRNGWLRVWRSVCDERGI